MLREAIPGGAYWPRFFLFLALSGGSSLAAAADFGGAGLLDLPNARMRPDGVLTLGTSQQDTEDIYSVTYQAFPWLEGTFRYVIQNPGGKLGSREANRDRSFEVKALLLEESALTPALALGLRDMLGTGVFSSEYLVASKRLGRADLTLGMGWGRLASRNRLPNPVAQLFDGARARTATTGLGGEPSVEDFFRGEDVGIFGGVEFDLPYQTRLLAEYTSDAYERETRFGTLKDPSPFSYGLGWRPAQG